MREVKFRGKRVDNGKWVYGNYLSRWTGRKYKHYIHGSVWDEYEVIPETVGQFTGLHDKNSKEVYEVDVGKDVYERIFCIVFVDYRTDCYGIMARFNDGSYCHLENLRNPKVIGNIHDNPELLQGEVTTNASQMVHLP